MSASHLILLSIGVISLFAAYSFLLESIFTSFPFGLVITTFQGMVYILVGLPGLTKLRIPLQTHINLAILLSLSMAMTNTSLQYVSLPLQVVFKSSKILPVMGAGFFFGKQYSKMQYSASCIIVLGLFLSSSSNSSAEGNTAVGVLLLSFAVLADSLLANSQAYAINLYRADSNEVATVSFLLSTPILFLTALITGQLHTALPMLTQRNLTQLCLYSLVGAIGVRLVILLLRDYGPLVSVMVTSCRKVVTVVLSILFFNSELSFSFFLGALLVLIGVLLHATHPTPAVHDWDEEANAKVRRIMTV